MFIGSVCSPLTIRCLWLVLLIAPCTARKQKTGTDFRDIVKCNKVQSSFHGLRCLQEEPIGRGSLSLAFLVEYKQKRRVLLIQHKNSTEAMKIREAIGSHPNIIEIDRFRASKKWSFYIMEWGELGSVSDLRRSHLELFHEPVFALSFLGKIVDALVHISERGFVHSDLKLANIVVDANYNPKIIDFELATRKDRKYYWRGTTSYMAPEVLEQVIIDKRFYYTEKVDVYSTGVLFYRMMFGDYPHEERNRTLLLTDIAENYFYFPEGLDIEMTKIVAGCLRYDRKERFSLLDLRAQINNAIAQKGRRSLWQFTGINARKKPLFIEERKSHWWETRPLITVVAELAVSWGVIWRVLVSSI